MKFKNNYICILVFYLLYCMNGFWNRNIISRNHIISNHKYIFNENNFMKVNQKIISISPAGFLGYYVLGTCTYIKENYDLSNYIFSGASAGAWNSLYMTFHGEPIEFVLDIIEGTKKIKKIIDIERNMKATFLLKYNESNFNLEKLFIGVTTLRNFRIYTNIYSDFNGLEDALDCCIASSHIPFVNGLISNKYKNIYTFDGGFSKNPYLITKSVLHLTPNMWHDMDKSIKINDDCYNLINNSIFYRDKYDFWNLFENGYNDAKKNKAFLDSILLEL